MTQVGDSLVFRQRTSTPTVQHFITHARLPSKSSHSSDNMAKKKGKKNSKKEKSSQIATPWDDLDIDTLQEKVENLSSEHSTVLQERILAQNEHDAVRSYYNITKQQIQDVDTQLRLANYDMEHAIQDHEAEIQVYNEKIQQLRYDFERKLQLADEAKRTSIVEQHEAYHRHLIEQEDVMLAIREELKERQNVYVEEIKQEKIRLDEELKKLSHDLEDDLDKFQAKCRSHEEQITKDLDLKREVELRDLEEQSNLHLSELERKHEELYQTTLIGYQKLDEENVTKITQMEGERDRMFERIQRSNEKSHELDKENNRVSQPLAELTSRVNEIKAKIKEKEKNKQYLLNVRSRTIVVRDRIDQQKDINEKLQTNFDRTKRERDQLENELKRILSEAEQKKVDHNDKYGPLSKTVDNTALQLRSFRKSVVEEQSQFIIKGKNSQNADREEKKLSEKVASSQRCFDEAMSRIKTEVKSNSLNQQSVGIPCPN